MANREYVIAGPGTRKRVVVASNIVVGHSGDLQVWSDERLLQALANGEWSMCWEEDKRNSVTKT